MQGEKAMMQRWGAEAVRFMRNASEYGNHYELLAAELLSYLPKDGHICDAGCGLGYLSRELAKYCREVTAVDRSEAALSVLREHCPPQNLHICCDDIFTMDARYDAMVMCYFGHTDEILRLAARCDGNMIVVRRDCSRHKFSIGTVARNHQNANNLHAELSRMGIAYGTKTLQIELGQPFESVDDAVTFFELYNKSEQAVERGEVQRRLVPTGREDYPWYLPGKRDMELTVFSANDVR